jgi:hypothetical protein
MNCEVSLILGNILGVDGAYYGSTTNKLGSVVDLLMNANEHTQVGAAALVDKVELRVYILFFINKIFVVDAN